MNNIFFPTIEIHDFLAWPDWLLIIFILLSFIIAPKLFSRKNSRNDESEYLLMSRSLAMPMFVATICSSWYGGIFGVTQIAFEHGFYGFVTQGLSWYLAYFIFAVLFAKKIRELKLASLPELIGQNFGPKARRIAGAILFFHALPVTYILSLGIFIQIISGLSFSLSVIFGALIVSVYAFRGGMRAIVITDAIQFLLMFSSVILVAACSFWDIGSFAFLKSKLPLHYFSYKSDQSTIAVFTWFLAATTTTLIHPVFYQRCLAAKDNKTAVGGIILAIFFWILFDFCTTTGSLFAKALMPEADSEKAYLFYGLQLLPYGLRGIFICGILSTIISTLDSFLFVSSTSLSYDVFPSKTNAVFRHKKVLVFSAIISTFLALFFSADFESLWLFTESIFSSVLFLPVMIAVFKPQNLSLKCFLTPLFCSLLSYLGCSLLKFWGLNFQPLILAHLSSCCALAILYMATRKAPPKLRFSPTDRSC